MASAAASFRLSDTSDISNLYALPCFMANFNKQNLLTDGVSDKKESVSIMTQGLTDMCKTQSVVCVADYSLSLARLL